jgi:hypothetical protein
MEFPSDGILYVLAYIIKYIGNSSVISNFAVHMP